MTREEILLELQQEYSLRQEENLRIHDARVMEASAKDPEIAALLQKRHAMVIGSIRSRIINGGKDSSGTDIAALMADMNEKIRVLLVKSGFSADYLQPVYTCPVCQDTGYLYDPSRRMCDCLSRRLNQRLLEEAGLFGDEQTFENFDLSLFSDTPEPSGTSQRSMANLCFGICKEYAENFPDTKHLNLLLTGKSGLGKTYLLRSIAHAVAQRGIQTVYTSSYHFLEVARKAYMENSSAPMSELLLAPLVLIDDLGTEPLMQNVTVTQLFNLLNERDLKGLHTVISTNLTVTELKERYTERIASRLLDSSKWRRLSFIGEDIRKRLKRS